MDELTRRGQAVEGAFYKAKDQELLAKLREEMKADEGRDALAAISGVKDKAVLDHLIESGISPESLTSLSLIPLVAVAWSDGKIQDGERKAILESAGAAGMNADSTGYQLLESWLAEQPGDDLLNHWKEYIGALKTTLDEAAFGQLKVSVLGRAQAVAEAAGGFPGLGNKVSESEQTVLDELAAAF